MGQHCTLWSDIVNGHHIAVRQRPADTAARQTAGAGSKFIEIDGKAVTLEKGHGVLSGAGRFDVIERYALDSPSPSEEAGLCLPDDGDDFDEPPFDLEEDALPPAGSR